MPETTETMQKYFDEKFAALADDLGKSKISPIKEEFQRKLDDLKNDIRKERDVLPVGPLGKTKVFSKQPKLDVELADMSQMPEMKGIKWTPDYTRNLSGFGRAAWAKQHNAGLNEEVSKALGETLGSTGGFLVPVEFKPELLRLIIEKQVVRPRATVIPMQTDLARIPRIVDTTHASSIHGGVTGTFGPEAGTLGTGDPAFGQVELKAKKFSDYVTVSNELIQDSPIAIAPLLGVLLREGLSFFEDVSALWGTGANAMAGIMSSTTNPALISVTRAVASHVKYADVTGMFSRMFPSSLADAIWVASPSVFPDLAEMSVAVGTGGSAVWITNMNTAVGAPPATIFGRPVVFSEKMSQLGTAGDLAFIDPSYYLIGDRMEMSLTTSEHVAFASDQTAFRIIERLDGAPWIASALTPNKQTSTLSAFVALS